MKHLHHIVPKHMGGTDEPHNLIELTVAEHAEAHRLLFEQYGLWEDEVAWKGLAGIIGKEEIIRRVQSEAAKERIARGNPFSGIKTDSNFALNSSHRERACNLAKSEKSRKKRKETFAKIAHQVGEKNSNYGKRWIHSFYEKRSKTINKNDPLPEGWLEGRKMKFDDV